jgi:signal peptidase
VLFALLGLVLAAVTVLIVLPRATHGAALTVVTGSMTPDIPVGSVVLDRPVDPGTLRVGDIATYQKAPGVDEYITHRIVQIDTSTSPTTFVFKGDANRGPDIKPVPAGAIRGKVWFHVPYLGGVRDSLSGAFGRTLLLSLVIVGLSAFALKQIMGGVRDRGRANTAGPDGVPPTMTIVVVLALDALDGLDPVQIARLLGGTYEALPEPPEGRRSGRRAVMRFTGSEPELEHIRALLAPFAFDVDHAAAGAGLADPDEESQHTAPAARAARRG